MEDQKVIDIDKTKKIRAILEEIINIVRNDGELYRFPGLEAGIRYVDGLLGCSADIDTLKGLKSIIKGMYKGMGTFDDLVIGGRSGKLTEEEKNINKRLSQLKRELYDLVDSL